MQLTEAELSARLRDVERHMGEVPPHHSGGLHDSLQRQRDDLQRELAARRRARDAAATPLELRDPRANAVRAPAATTPLPVVGTFRRTTHVAAGPDDGEDWGAGEDVARRMHGACRDVLATAAGTGTVRGLTTMQARIGADHRLTELRLEPGPQPEALVGGHALPGMRRLVRDLVDDLSSTRAAVLLDLGVGGTLSGYARLQAGRAAGKTSSQAMRPDALAILGDSCRGWALEGDMVALLRSGVNRPPKPPPSVPGPDLEGWHDLGEFPRGWMRRRRRVDVTRLGPRDPAPGLRIDAAFRDSWRDPEGEERALHEWELVLHLDADGAVTSADATARSLPFDVCPSVTQNLVGLVGATMDGLRERTRDVLGGIGGCTHLNDLLSTIPAAVEAATRNEEHA